MQRSLARPLFLGLSVVIAGSASAQTTQVVIEAQDPVVGVGSIEKLQNLTVNDTGQWLVIADTDATPVARDYVVLRYGFPVIREGDPVATPEGATVNSLQNSSWRVDDSGNLLWSFRINGPGITQQNDRCIYWNVRLLAQERGLLDAPEMPCVFDEETGDEICPIFIDFLSFDFVTPDHALVACVVDDPEVSGGLNEALVSITYDEFGFLQETHVVISAKDEFPTDLFPDDRDSNPQVFERLPNASLRFFRANKHGDFLWGPILEDGRELLMIGLDRVVAQVGDVFEDPTDAALDGRAIRNFSNFECDLNDLGDFTYTCGLDGDMSSNALFVLNGEKFVQEGDALPSFNGATMGATNASAFAITNSGNLYWVADLNNTLSSENMAYMRNTEVIIRKGQTFLNDKLVTDLRSSVQAIEASRDGRFFVGEVALEGNNDALALVDFGLALPLPGCNPGAGKLGVSSGTANAGKQLTLAFENGQEPGVATVFILARNRLGSGDCGGMTPFGDLFIAPPFVFTGVGFPWVGGPAPLDVQIPNQLGLVDTTWWGQGLFLDIGGQLPGDEDLRLTNGIKLEIGAP